MFQKEKNINFTGFVVYYSDGTRVLEKENYYSRKLKKKCATNWAEIDKEKIVALELIWCNQPKVKIEKKPSESTHKNELTSKDWFFSQRGYLDLTTNKTIVLIRNIGYVEDNNIYITSISEQTGDIHKSIRAK